MSLWRNLQNSNSSLTSVLRAKENQLLTGKRKITNNTPHGRTDELTNREKCQGLEKVEIVVEMVEKSAKTTLKSDVQARAYTRFQVSGT